MNEKITAKLDENKRAAIGPVQLERLFNQYDAALRSALIGIEGIRMCIPDIGDATRRIDRDIERILGV